MIESINSTCKYFLLYSTLLYLQVKKIEYSRKSLNNKEFSKTLVFHKVTQSECTKFHKVVYGSNLVRLCVTLCYLLGLLIL
jgi:hypothetical protein